MVCVYPQSPRPTVIYFQPWGPLPTHRLPVVSMGQTVAVYLSSRYQSSCSRFDSSYRVVKTCSGKADTRLTIPGVKVNLPFGVNHDMYLWKNRLPCHYPLPNTFCSNYLMQNCFMSWSQWPHDFSQGSFSWTEIGNNLNLAQAYQRQTLIQTLQYMSKCMLVCEKRVISPLFYLLHGRGTTLSKMRRRYRCQAFIYIECEACWLSWNFLYFNVSGIFVFSCCL